MENSPVSTRHWVEVPQRDYVSRYSSGFLALEPFYFMMADETCILATDALIVGLVGFDNAPGIDNPLSIF